MVASGFSVPMIDEEAMSISGWSSHLFAFNSV